MILMINEELTKIQ